MGLLMQMPLPLPLLLVWLPQVSYNSECGRQTLTYTAPTSESNEAYLQPSLKVSSFDAFDEAVLVPATHSQRCGTEPRTLDHRQLALSWRFFSRPPLLPKGRST